MQSQPGVGHNTSAQHDLTALRLRDHVGVVDFAID
jgi:hypothetical protein